MIPIKVRESRRSKAFKLSKTLEQFYKEEKCRECAVVVTRMDFAKILGKFTKVKIQYESSVTPKSKQNAGVSPNSNTRLKSNENGMIRVHRKAYNEHPVKQLLGSKKPKINESQNLLKVNNNVLKENNRLKKAAVTGKSSNYNDESPISSNLKRYGIVFVDPTTCNNKESKSIISLEELLPKIDHSILPSEDWCIDYFPNSDEPKDDKVYDRIAAELEDLMYSEKPAKSDNKCDGAQNKDDDFPSIMDILNDNVTENNEKPIYQSSANEIKTNLESSDVEAMLLGKSNPTCESEQATPMDVDNAETKNFVEEVNQLNEEQEAVNLPEKNDVSQETNATDDIDNPQSPSILDVALEKGIEEHLPPKSQTLTETQTPTETQTITETQTPTESETLVESQALTESQTLAELQTLSESQTFTEAQTLSESQTFTEPPVVENSDNEISPKPCLKIDEDENTKVGNKNKENKIRMGITQVVFKKTRNGTCYKSVACPKNLKYSIELEEKSVEFLGAPKYISSLEDLQVLLQIVNETELDSLYVMQ